ncbi:MAG: hypothetical protein ACXVW6_05545 [Nocardioidaceae bacterium]
MSGQVSEPTAAIVVGPPAPARRGGSVLADVAVVLGIFVLLGVACGVLWWLLVDPATFTKVARGGEMGDVQLGRRFGADAWYVVLGSVAGLPAGAALTWWRSRDYLLTSGLVAVGSVLAAALSAVVGRVLGPGDPNVALATAARGTQVPVPLEVTAHVAYLVWPIAALAGALLVLWSKPLEPEL